MGAGKVRVVRRLALAGCAGLIGLLGPVPGRAQFAPSLPYSPYNGQNLTFSYPTVVNPSLPNGTRLMYGSPNQFAPYSLDAGLSGVDALGTGSFPRGGRGVPYYSSSRDPERFSSSYEDANSEFAANQARRDVLYVQIAQERDPKKREALQKELADVNAALDKGLGRAQRRTGSGKAGTGGAGSGTAGAARRGTRSEPLDPPRRTGPPKRPKAPARPATATPPADAGSGAAEPDAAPGVAEPSLPGSTERAAVPGLPGLDSSLSLPGLTDPTLPSALDSLRRPRRRSTSLSDMASPNALRQRSAGTGLSGALGTGSLGAGRPLPGTGRPSPRTPEVKPPGSAGTGTDVPNSP